MLPVLLDHARQMVWSTTHHKTDESLRLPDTISTLLFEIDVPSLPSGHAWVPEVGYALLHNSWFGSRECCNGILLSACTLTGADYYILSQVTEEVSEKELYQFEDGRSYVKISLKPFWYQQKARENDLKYSCERTFTFHPVRLRDLVVSENPTSDLDLSLVVTLYAFDGSKVVQVWSTILVEHAPLEMGRKSAHGRGTREGQGRVDEGRRNSSIQVPIETHPPLPLLFALATAALR